MMSLLMLSTEVTVQPPCSKRFRATSASPLVVVLFNTTSGTRWVALLDGGWLDADPDGRLVGVAV
jgi:hypothetical protein